MLVIVTYKKKLAAIVFLTITGIVVGFLGYDYLYSTKFCLVLPDFILGEACPESNSAKTPPEETEMIRLLHQILAVRNNAVVRGEVVSLKPFYDLGRKLGVWAFEHQSKKVKYLNDWSEKQGVRFTSVKSMLKLRRIKEGKEGLTVNFTASTEYRYVYRNAPQKINLFRIGTYHSMDLIPCDGRLLIAREWYTDPFADSLSQVNLENPKLREFIMAQPERNFTRLHPGRIGAVEYADKYCGAAGAIETGWVYNNKYRNYNYSGGDCANFASQILFEGGKLPKNNIWNYQKTAGSRAWVNAQAFTDYMLGSGRGSLLARGKYEEVLEASYRLLPGDFIAYQKKGKVAHISVVTGADSKGYTLVNSHNADRYRVPWDLGWGNRNIKFWLVRVNF